MNNVSEWKMTLIIQKQFLMIDVIQKDNWFYYYSSKPGKMKICDISTAALIYYAHSHEFKMTRIIIDKRNW